MSVDKTLEERGSRYGQFADHARIAQGIQDVMRAAPKWDDLDLDMKQALSVIADKIARILNGDPFYIDNWHDIQGYSQLIEKRLQMLEAPDDSLYGDNSPSTDVHIEINTEAVNDQQMSQLKEIIQRYSGSQTGRFASGGEVFSNQPKVRPLTGCATGIEPFFMNPRQIGKTLAQQLYDNPSYTGTAVQVPNNAQTFVNNGFTFEYAKDGSLGLIDITEEVNYNRPFEISS